MRCLSRIDDKGRVIVRMILRAHAWASILVTTRGECRAVKRTYRRAVGNGQDLTYFWSAELPPETGFGCPIPTWTVRETHVAVRSGQHGLGCWWQEERSLNADYQRFIGTPGKRDEVADARLVQPPTRIVRVWLIANSMFRQQEGQCEYVAIELQAGDTAVTVN